MEIQCEKKFIKKPKNLPLNTGRKLNVQQVLRKLQDVFWMSYVRLIYILCPWGFFSESVFRDRSRRSKI